MDIKLLNNNDLLTASLFLKSKNLSVVLKKENEVFIGTERGVAPLLRYFEDVNDYSGFCAADKVVGKAAAYIYVLLGIKSVFAVTASLHAIKVFEKYGIEYVCENTVPAIKNRTGTGLCPMESAVLDIDTPEEALRAIRNMLRELKGK